MKKIPIKEISESMLASNININPEIVQDTMHNPESDYYYEGSRDLRAVDFQAFLSRKIKNPERRKSIEKRFF